jgi:hypothetical protein
MTAVTLSSDDPRSLRAVELAASADRWSRQQTASGTVYRIPSQRTFGRAYMVTPTSCDCYDALHTTCKASHGRGALRIAQVGELAQVAVPMTTAETISGIVQRTTSTGVCVDGAWYSISKFHPLELPAVGRRVRLLADDKRLLKQLEVLDDVLAPSTRSAGRDETIVRLAVLTAAACFAANKDLKSGDVLQIAERWLALVSQ